MRVFKTSRLGLCLSMALAAVIAAGGGALADPFPTKPIKLVVPYRAGGGTDSLARMIQKAIEKNKLLPVPVTVVNVTGAGGTVGSRQVKDAKPDGYTILQIHQGMFAVSATGRVDYTPADFEPIIMTTQSCLYLGVKGDGPYKNFQDLVDAAKANPNKLKMADIIGGVSHFPAVMLMNATGAKFGVVQTGGTSKRFASIKGGFTQLAFFSPGWIKRGGDDLRGVLWLGPTRHPAAPDMPTAIELGYDVSACLNRRYWAPKGTSPEHIKILADAIEAAARTPELAAYHKKRLSSVVIQRGDVLRAAVKKEYAEFLEAAPTVRAAMGK